MDLRSRLYHPRRDSPLMVYLTTRMQNEDSRNELIRIALHGLLRRGLYSSTSDTTTAASSTISTFKDADDISKDSLGDYSHSEGEVVFPRDPVPVLYGPRSNLTDDQASTHRRSKASPGELSPTALQTNRGLSPGEITTRPGTRRIQSATPLGRVPVSPNSPPGQQRQTPLASRENSDSRSLHKSDLQQQERAWVRTSPQAFSREGSPSLGKSPGSQSPRSKGSSPRNYQPVSRPPIHVPISPMDAYDSSGYSKDRRGDRQGDTSGDVSSISGGDF